MEHEFFNEFFEEDRKEFKKPHNSMRDDNIDAPYSANFTKYDSMSALKETAGYIVYVAQLIEKAEKEADAAKNSIEAAAAQTNAKEAFDAVNQLNTAVNNWLKWDASERQQKIIVRTSEEIAEIADAVMKVENAVREANRAYIAVNYRVSSLAAAEADVVEARAAATAAELALAEVEARLAAIEARLAAAARPQDMHSAAKHSSRRLANARARSEARRSRIKPLAEGATRKKRKKKYRRRNKTKTKRYKRQIKRYTKNYRMRY